MKKVFPPQMHKSILPRILEDTCLLNEWFESWLHLPILIPDPYWKTQCEQIVKKQIYREKKTWDWWKWNLAFTNIR